MWNPICSSVEDNLAAHIFAEINGREIEVAGRVMGFRGWVSVAALKQEELGLGAGLHGEAALGRDRDDPLQRRPWAAGKRSTVRIGDVANEPPDASDANARAAHRIRPGKHLEGREVRFEVHVGLFDPDEAFDRRPIEHDVAVERFLELPVRHLDILDDAQDVGELQAQELHALTFGALQDLFAKVGHAPILGSKVPRFQVPSSGHLEAVRLLLDSGADPDAGGVSGESLITVARDRGHETVADLLEAVRGRSARISPSAAAEADHAIQLAADANDAEAVRRMLDAEPQLVHRGDRKGGTPLHRAVIASALDVVTLLLDRGADVHALHGSGPGDASGYAAVDFQPIDLALFWHGRRDVEIARLLLQRGATYDLSVAAAFGDLRRITAQLNEDPGRIRQSRPSGKRPLSAAIDFDHPAIARLLLNRGADPNWPEGADAPRGFALHSAARLGNHEMVELLLDHGADPNAHVDSSGSATWAAKTSELRKLLLSRGGRLDCYDLVWLGEDDEVVRRVTADPAEANAGCGGVFTAAATLGKRDLLGSLEPWNLEGRPTVASDQASET